MKQNLQSKFTKFGIYIVLYVLGIFVFFNLVFAKKEIKKDAVIETIEETKITNANGIDVNKLSTKVNSGNPASVLTEKIVLDGLKKSDDKDIQEILKSKDK